MRATMLVFFAFAVVLASPAASDTPRPFNTFDSRAAVDADAVSGDDQPPPDDAPPPERAPAERRPADRAPADRAPVETRTTTARPREEAKLPSDPAARPGDPAALAKTVAVLEGAPPPAGEVKVDTLPPPPAHVSVPTPRFDLQGGVFLQQRGMAFDYDPYAYDAPPSYPETGLKGFAVAAAIYPMPIERYDGRMSGIGFSVKLAQSVGSSLTAEDETGFGEYTVQHNAWDAGVHYRYPIDKFNIDGEIAYGSWSHTIVDLPESIAIPDTSYQYLSAGGHVEVYPTQHASIGATVKYLYIMDSGDVTAEDWYGSGDAHGWQLGADVVVPLPGNLSLRGAVDWRKITLDLEGSGDLSWEWGVGTIEDTSLTGSAALGVQF